MAVTTTAEGRYYELILSGSDRWETATVTHGHENDINGITVQARWQIDTLTTYDLIEFRMLDNRSFAGGSRTVWLLKLSDIHILDVRDNAVARVYQENWKFMNYTIGHGRLYFLDVGGYPFDETIGMPWGVMGGGGNPVEFMHKAGEIGREYLDVHNWAATHPSTFRQYCGNARRAKDCRVKLRFFLNETSRYTSLQTHRESIIANARYVERRVVSLQTELSEVKRNRDELQKQLQMQEECDENAVRGDFNGDGRVNFSDFLIFVGLYEADN